MRCAPNKYGALGNLDQNGKSPTGPDNPLEPVLAQSRVLFPSVVHVDQLPELYARRWVHRSLYRAEAPRCLRVFGYQALHFAVDELALGGGGAFSALAQFRHVVARFAYRPSRPKSDVEEVASAR